MSNISQIKYSFEQKQVKSNLADTEYTCKQQEGVDQSPLDAHAHSLFSIPDSLAPNRILRQAQPSQPGGKVPHAGITRLFPCQPCWTLATRRLLVTGHQKCRCWVLIKRSVHVCHGYFCANNYAYTLQTQTFHQNFHIVFLLVHVELTFSSYYYLITMITQTYFVELRIFRKLVLNRIPGIFLKGGKLILSFHFYFFYPKIINHME